MWNCYTKGEGYIYEPFGQGKLMMITEGDINDYNLLL